MTDITLQTRLKNINDHIERYQTSIEAALADINDPMFATPDDWASMQLKIQNDMRELKSGLKSLRETEEWL